MGKPLGLNRPVSHEPQLLRNELWLWPDECIRPLALSLNLKQSPEGGQLNFFVATSTGSITLHLMQECDQGLKFDSFTQTQFGKSYH